jgi:hypothetical protein
MLQFMNRWPDASREREARGNADTRHGCVVCVRQNEAKRSGEPAFRQNEPSGSVRSIRQNEPNHVASSLWQNEPKQPGLGFWQNEPNARARRFRQNEANSPAGRVWHEPKARRITLEQFNISLGNGLSRLQGKVFRIGRLGDFSDLMHVGTLAGIEMGLELAEVPHRTGGVQAAMDVLIEAAKSPARLPWAG